MKKVIVFVYLVLINFYAISQDINKSEVEIVASNILNVKSKVKIDKQSVEINSISKNDTVLLYIADNGCDFVIISNDLRVQPILGYSDEGSFEKNNIPPQLLALLESYQQEILSVKRNKSKSFKSYKSEWDNYLKGNNKSLKTSVSPIIKVKWNQGSGWNRFCPEDVDGPGDHVYAGCVAVSMAQSMSVFEHPIQGVGESSYYPSGGYPLQSVNYGETQYNWNLMSSTSSDDYNSLLIFHCAVSVEMGFAPDGSGAYTRDIANSLEKYFDYSSSVYSKSSTEDQAWIDLLKSELDAGRPISYGGNNGSESGHAFNLDGYNTSDAFHVNWGWSGSSNGYFQIDNLTPNGSDYSKNATAVLGIKPKDHSPTNISVSNDNFVDTLSANSLICTILTIDPDNSDSFVYNVKGADGIFGESYCPFYIKSDSLMLLEKVSVDEYAKFRIILSTEDSQENTFEKQFEIDVLKSNYKPSDINVSNKEVDDTVKSGTLIGIFKTIDEDEVDSFVYALNTNLDPQIGKDNDKFFISNDSLYTNFNFKNYSDTVCSIYVTSSDKENETISKEFIININNIETVGIKINDVDVKLSIYPNPNFDGKFLMDLKSNNIKIGDKIRMNIYNMFGVIEKVVTSVYSGNEIYFNIDRKGYYIVQIIIEGKFFTKKICFE